MKIIMLDIDDTLLQNKTDPTKWAKSIMKQIPAGVAVALVTSRSDNLSRKPASNMTSCFFTKMEMTTRTRQPVNGR